MDCVKLRVRRAITGSKVDFKFDNARTDTARTAGISFLQPIDA